MKHYYNNNSDYLLFLKPNKFMNIFIIFFAFIVIILGVFLNIEIYDIKNYKAIFNESNCVFLVDINVEEVDNIAKSSYFYIDKNSYKYRIVSISELLANPSLEVNYQTIEMKVENDLCSWRNNQIESLEFKINKERALLKFWKQLVKE